MYRKNNSGRISQGDILKDVELLIREEDDFNIIKTPYSVVLSQDCDLNQDYDSHYNIQSINFEESPKKISSFFNKMIPSILLAPAYPDNQLRQGTHLEYIGLEMSKIGKRKDTRWKVLTQNETPRYHFLEKSEEFNLPNLVLDFKRFYSLSRNYMYEIFPDCYQASLNELYRENLSDRFFNYHSRIGLP